MSGNNETGIYDVKAIKDRLNAYRDREEYLAMERDRLDYLDSKISSVASPVLSDIPKAPSPAPDRMASAIANKIDLERKIDRVQEKQNNEKEYIEGLVSQLRKPKEQGVIEMRYIDCMDWIDVVDLMFGGLEDFLDKEDSYMRRIHLIHSSALVNLAKIVCESSN